MRRSFCIVFSLFSLFALPATARESSAKTYLNSEGTRILMEATKIASQADFMRLESDRLKSEASNLREQANTLDELWTQANQAAPEKFKNHPGRDKSQQLMRRDADREERDSQVLVEEGSRLDAEAERLRKLASAVNAQAEQDLIKRMLCCKRSDLNRLRAEIVLMARSLGTNYDPSFP